MDWNTTTSANDDEIVFKIKRSVIAEALRSDFEMPIPVTDANIDVVVNQIAQGSSEDAVERGHGNIKH